MSSPVRRALLKETPVMMLKANRTRRSFPGWLTFVFDWRGKHLFPVALTGVLSTSMMKPF